MKLIPLVLIFLGTVDLIGCAVILGSLWMVHQKNRRAAAATGAPVPASATGSFVFLGTVAILSVLLMYGVAAIISLE